MSGDLVIRDVSEPKKDEHGNWDYWVRCEGVEMGIAVKHKGDKPVMRVGETLQQHGFTWLEEKTSGRGNKYFKARRPERQGGGSNGGGSRPDDPATRASIERQVAAKIAGELLVAMIANGFHKPEAASIATDHRALTNDIAQTIGGAS